MGVVGAGAAALGAGIAYNSQIENYTAGFETMLGSAEAADKMLSGLKTFAEKTPFEMSDLAQASTTLLAFGEDIDNLMPDLKMLGDISLGNKEKFNGLALVFGQVQSQGKLMGQDLLQMINQGFNPLQIISDKTGESMSSLKDKMSKGQISFEMVADAMVLKDRLYELEGQIKSGALSEAEAKAVQEDFNGTAKQLEEIIPGITTAIYDETGAINIQIGKVEALTQSYYDLARAKAMVNAYQSYIDQTAKDLVEVEEKLKPYEAGEKAKTYYSSYLGMELEHQEYTELIKLREQYNLDMKGYITNLNTWQNQAAENSTNKTKEEEKKKTQYVTTQNKERTKSTEKANEEDLRNLKYYHDMGKLSDEEYYLALTDYRDKYFAEGSEEWQTYTKEIYNYTSGLCDKVIDEVNGLSQKLKGFGDLFTTKTDKLTMFDASVGHEVTMQHSYVELGDISKQNEELQKYSAWKGCCQFRARHIYRRCIG